MLSFVRWVMVPKRDPKQAVGINTVPQIPAVVEWDEGPRFATELVDVEPTELQIGMPVVPVFTDHPEAGVTLLRYTAQR